MHSLFDLKTTKACFIFNPHSGHNQRNPYLLEFTRKFIAEQGLDARVALTERPRHATEIAKAAVAEGCGLVAAIGGDGTLNETAAALVGTPAVFGLIPCGSGNGLARHLNLPGPRKGAYENLLTGAVRSIDTGTANGVPFFNVMGLGFDAEISARFNRLTSRGLSAYIKTGVTAWRTYEPAHYEITGGDKTIASDAFIVAVANSDQYGNNCFVAPGAKVDDGRLNLTVLKKVGLLSALPLVARMFLARMDGTSSVARAEGARFTIKRSAPGPIHTDGEVHEMDATVEVEVKPRSLHVLCPRT
ncbi:MAG: diacylglycerol kinase family lipid kinase [Synoicihabitans sp.]